MRARILPFVVRGIEPSSSSFAGSLLIAQPSLGDPNFRKTVLFISSYDPKEGTFALILNRPAERTVGDVLPEKELGVLNRVPVFLGGPVGADQLVFAAFEWHPDTQRIECRHHLGIDEAQQSAVAQNTVVRAFIGYAGWTKGQLEAELQQNAWLLTKPTPGALDMGHSKTLWRELLSGFGPKFRLAAEAPDDLSRN